MSHNFIKWLKSIVRFVLGLFSSIAIILIACVAPIDRKPLHHQDYYIKMMAQLDTLEPAVYPASGSLHAAWGRINITPEEAMPMSGYKPRKAHEDVHDSLYISVLYISNGGVDCFVISADMLMFPPRLRDMLMHGMGQSEKLEKSFMYFSATHSHSSVGGWDNTRAGSIYSGAYREAWLNDISTRIMLEMETLKTKSMPVSIEYFEQDASQYVRNRLAGDKGKTDGKIRGLKFTDEKDSTVKAYLYSYSAHATLIPSKSLALSGDYPAAVNRALWQKEKVFGMYMAGMVGSHAINNVEGAGFEKVARAGEVISSKLMENHDQIALEDSLTIKTCVFDLEHGSPQMKIAKHFRIRPWLFNMLFGGLSGQFKVLMLGNVVLMGTPGEFSGEIFINSELEAFSAKHKKNLIITGFNGDYTGYVVFDGHYDNYAKEEVRFTNWSGPYFGQYYTEIIKKTLTKF